VNFLMRRAIAVHRRGTWPEEEALDTVKLAFVDRHRRRIRLVAASEQTYLLDLPRAHHLVEGDGLELESGGYLRVSAAAEPLFEITAASRKDLLRIAWHLGNRHLPVQIAGERLRIRPDHVIAEMVTGLGGRVVELEAPFDPETGAYHEHE
jgi:urease accessory protein